jgi:hypothetical protein
MAKERLFDLPQTRGSFQLKGKISGVEKDNFFTEKKTKNGGDFRAVNFGVTYDEHATVFVGVNGTTRDKVYFSKRNPDTKKTETKAVNWNQRESFKEDGWNIIGINCGIEQKRNEKGAVENITKSMVEYDAAQYLSAYLEDDMDVFMSGNVEFNSFTNKNGEVTSGINFRPNRIYACKAPIDFEKEDYVPQHDFKQTIVFKEINQEKENDKATGRFIVSAWIVNYASIENADFIIEDKGLANIFKKNLKEYTAISVWGNINCRVVVEEVASDGYWGASDPTKRINNPVVREMVITGADPASRDTETYTEQEMNKAFTAIRKSQNAESNFADNDSDDSSTGSWGSSSSFDEDGDEPW